jgi:hypothetical protein
MNTRVFDSFVTPHYSILPCCSQIQSLVPSSSCCCVLICVSLPNLLFLCVARNSNFQGPHTHTHTQRVAFQPPHTNLPALSVPSLEEKIKTQVSLHQLKQSILTTRSLLFHHPSSSCAKSSPSTSDKQVAKSETLHGR